MVLKFLKYLIFYIWSEITLIQFLIHIMLTIPLVLILINIFEQGFIVLYIISLAIVFIAKLLLNLSYFIYIVFILTKIKKDKKDIKLLINIKDYIPKFLKFVEVFILFLISYLTLSLNIEIEKNKEIIPVIGLIISYTHIYIQVQEYLLTKKYENMIKGFFILKDRYDIKSIYDTHHLMLKEYKKNAIFNALTLKTLEFAYTSNRDNVFYNFFKKKQ